jgi:hypothetical protein
MTMLRCGAIAWFLLAATFFAPSIYFFGRPPEGVGLSSYDLADFLYGPVWGASLVTAIFVLRERFGGNAPRRMTLALLAATLAAGASVMVALIRSTNRHFLAARPDLDPTMVNTLLTAWTTVVTGVIATRYHFLGWALVLLGSAVWSDRRRDKVLSGLYLVGGMTSLFGYLQVEGDMGAALFGVILSIWQGIRLWDDDPESPHAPETSVNRPRRALARAFDRLPRIQEAPQDTHGAMARGRSDSQPGG